MKCQIHDCHLFVYKYHMWCAVWMFLLSFLQFYLMKGFHGEFDRFFVYKFIWKSPGWKSVKLFSTVWMGEKYTENKKNCLINTKCTRFKFLSTKKKNQTFSIEQFLLFLLRPQEVNDIKSKLKLTID